LVQEIVQKQNTESHNRRYLASSKPNGFKIYPQNFKF